VKRVYCIAFSCAPLFPGEKHGEKTINQYYYYYNFKHRVMTERLSFF
jgi:hypothetical protein